MLSFRRLLLSAVVVALAACGSPGEGDDAGPTDAGQGVDSGTPVDAGTPVDSGTPEDAGLDAGAVDAGFDAGVVDAGFDAGVVDAGFDAGLQTVFIIVMENHSWSSIKGSSSAPYLNSLASSWAHAEHYYTPANNHPSEPNYIWMEAGDNLSITTDDAPSLNHQSTTDHLVTQLEAAGISWKAYSEDISGTDCPLTASGLYDPKHTPMVFFDDVTNTNSSSSTHCKSHVRPYTELAGDLTANTVARYNFITPNLCHDMHGQALGTSCNIFVTDMIKTGDDWLAAQVPAILSSQAFLHGGVLFIVWDEGDEGLIGSASDGPIGMLVLSPQGKSGGYSNTVSYTHSSLLRTVETIFHVPYLRGAANAADLSDLFTRFP
jgi:phospholipase C